MNITADSIQQSCAGSSVLEHQIKSILKTIQFEILEASKMGATSVIVPIPTNFNVIHLPNKIAQTIIYHKLIERIEDRGFTVKILLKNSLVFYHVGWDMKKDNHNLKVMREVIASHIEKKVR